MKVPFNKPPICGGEIENIRTAISSGPLQGGGKFMGVCESLISGFCAGRPSLLTNSCTASLEMAAMLCDIKPGDEIIVPTYTFVSTVSAFVLRGAKPVFCDIRADTLNIDETKIEELITPKTRAIVPVHYAGVACEMDTIMDIAKRHNLLVVEDAAQGFFAFYKDKPLGSIGDLGSLSFHGTKNVVCGEGGALIVNMETAPNRNVSATDRANFIREKGTNRIHFLKGKIDKYTWVDLGSSYIPSELSAAFLAAQLPHTEELTRKRVEAWNFYKEALAPLEKKGLIKTGCIPDSCRTNGHIFYIITESEKRTKELADFLAKREISSNSHYVPLHTCPMAKQLGCPDVKLPVAEFSAKAMLRLPIHSYISKDELEYVCESVEAGLK